MGRLIAVVIAALLLPGPASWAQGTRGTPLPVEKTRLIVLTDIGNEPDDSESMIRLLTYSNEFDIEGLIASTSVWMKNEVHPELIEHRVRAYGQVRPNLSVHASGYPPMDQLLSRIRAGSAVYGMKGVGDGKDTDASRLIIAAVDRPDPRPVWITIWGGAADLAQALWTIRATRTPAEVDRFVAKLRVYSISDQDDAGPWARANFPKLFWITSVHSFSDYRLATWIGMMGSGGDPTTTAEWLRTNIQSKGPLGAMYPRVAYGNEGDTPSFLYLIPTGLGSPEHPDWGSWGGRYGQLADFLGLWASASGTMIGANGQPVSNNQVTVARWRSAFQNDFVARMDWSIHSRFADANHPPQLRLNGIPGNAPVEFTACAGEPVKLSAEGSRDPDRGQVLTYHWWYYSDLAPIGTPPVPVKLDRTDGPETTAVVGPIGRIPGTEIPASYQFHVILEVTDNGTPALTRYRRAVIVVPTNGGCPAPTTLPPVNRYWLHDPDAWRAPIPH